MYECKRPLRVIILRLLDCCGFSATVATVAACAINETKAKPKQRSDDTVYRQSLKYHKYRQMAECIYLYACARMYVGALTHFAAIALKAKLRYCGKHPEEIFLIFFL